MFEKQFGPIPKLKAPIPQICKPKGSYIVEGEMPPQILRVSYVRLPISDPIKIRYEPSQGGTLKSIENFQEGRFFVKRKLAFSIQNFLAAALNSLCYWRDSGAFHMTHGDSVGFNKLRNLSFEVSDSDEMIELEIVNPQFAYQRYFDREIIEGKEFLIIPLECIARGIMEHLKKTERFLVPAEFEFLLPEIKAYWNYQMKELPKQHLDDLHI